MGRDSVMPFLDYDGKWVILLALTSNPGSADFQLILTHPDIGIERDTDAITAHGAYPLFNESQYIYEKVIATAQSWLGPESHERLMFVVGATQAEELTYIRRLAPRHFLLVPGVGAQGGSLADVSRYGLTPDGGLLINASRSILYASDGTDFADRARAEAKTLQAEMATYLSARVWEITQ